MSEGQSFPARIFGAKIEQPDPNRIGTVYGAGCPASAANLHAARRYFTESSADDFTRVSKNVFTDSAGNELERVGGNPLLGADVTGPGRPSTFFVSGGELIFLRTRGSGVTTTTVGTLSPVTKASAMPAQARESADFVEILNG